MCGRNSDRSFSFFSYTLIALHTRNRPTEVTLAVLLDSPLVTSARSQTIAICVGWGLALVLASLPFELYMGVPFAGLTFTNVEIMVLAILAL